MNPSTVPQSSRCLSWLDIFNSPIKNHFYLFHSFWLCYSIHSFSNLDWGYVVIIFYICSFVKISAKKQFHSRLFLLDNFIIDQWWLQERTSMAEPIILCGSFLKFISAAVNGDVRSAPKVSRALRPIIWCVISAGSIRRYISDAKRSWRNEKRPVIQLAAWRRFPIVP